MRAARIVAGGAPQAELRAQVKKVHDLMREAQKKVLAAAHVGCGAARGGEAVASEAAWRKARGWKRAQPPLGFSTFIIQPPLGFPTFITQPPIIDHLGARERAGRLG